MGNVNSTAGAGGLAPGTPVPGSPSPSGAPAPPVVPDPSMTAGPPASVFAGGGSVNTLASQTIKGDKYTNGSQKFFAPAPATRTTDPGLIVEQGPATGTLPDQFKLQDLSGASPKPPLPTAGGGKALSGQAWTAIAVGLASLGVAAGLGAATTHNATQASDNDNSN